MTPYRALLVLFLISPSIFAQNEEKDIKKVIDTFFDGMREADSLKIKSTVIKDCTLRSVIINGKTDMTQLSNTDIAEFITGVCNHRKGKTYDERLLSYDIKIDGKMGIAWTPYRFYLNDKFLHCGVNVFSLALYDEGWKIISILDTRRKSTCEED